MGTSNLSVGELSNSPREIKLGSDTLKIRQLKIKELFAFFETKIKNQKIKDANEMAELLDPIDKKMFLMSVWRELPSGTELTNMIADSMSSVDGAIDVLYLASKDFQEVSIESIGNMIDYSELPEITYIINWIIGGQNGVESGEEVNEDDEAVEANGDTIEKKTVT